MLEWLSYLFADAAFGAAIYSAGLASKAGMFQIEEPECLQMVAKEHKLKLSKIG